VKVLTLGTFDLFHHGHVALLRRCAALGYVVVGLNTDSFVYRYKGSLPVIDYIGREAVLDACAYVSAVVPNDQHDGSIRDVLDAVHPDLIVVGSDWRDRDYLRQLGLDEEPCPILYVPYTVGISTSAIKERVA
jgi:glycerol-3-phosphate cytidylyltransferase